VIPFEEAHRHVVGAVSVLDTVELPLLEAAGLVVAEDVTSPIDVPPFASSAMDGIAVRARDTSPGARLKVVGTIAAGSGEELVIGSGEAARIMTGAPVPPGADAVVMVEQLTFEGDEVLLERSAQPDANIRPAGDDVVAGGLAIRAGSAVTPAVIGAAGTVGVDTLPVVRRPAVGVFSTGDELVEPGIPLGHGQIHDSNRRSLLSLVAQVGCTPVDLGCLPDDRDRIEQALLTAVEACDAVVTSGGVSMGEFDEVKAVLARIAEMRWMQIAIRPAKPLAFGTVTTDRGGAVPVFGLPGNPVSAHVSFELFARPALRKMMGHERVDLRRLSAIVPEGIVRRVDGKVHLDRVVLDVGPDGGLVAAPLDQQGSHQTVAMALANALAVVPDGVGVPPGGVVEVIPLRSDW
jgi:molybdenum cofactor synthesis domain-containing protein